MSSTGLELGGLPLGMPCRMGKLLSLMVAILLKVQARAMAVL